MSQETPKAPSIDIIDNILSAMPDKEGIIDGQFRQTAIDAYISIVRERITQDLPPYTPGETAILVSGLHQAAVIHQGQRRHDNSTHFQGHLAPVGKIAVERMGITRPANIVGCYLHDAEEDQRIKPADLFPKALFADLLRRFPDPEIDPDEIERSVINMATSLSKERRATRSETMTATFRKLLERASGYGPRLIYAKIADRIQNLTTLDKLAEKKPESAKRTIEETEDIFILFAHIFHTRLALSDLVEGVLRFNDTGGIMRHFDALASEATKQFRKNEAMILAVLDPKIDKRTTLEKLTLRNIKSIAVTQAHIAEYLPYDGRRFAELAENDLVINPFHPMIEITVLVQDERLIELIADHIWKTFGGSRAIRGPEKNEITPVRRGKTIYIWNPAFGGRLKFRINVDWVEARAKRGILPVGRDSFPEGMRREIEYILGRTKNETRRNMIIPFAKESLLQPRKYAFTPGGKKIETSRRGTYLDAASQVHSDFLIGLQDANVSSDFFGTGFFGKIFPFDEFRDGETIDFKTCIEEGQPVHGSVVGSKDPFKIDPGWRYFCSEKQTDDAILEYLRHPGSSVDPKKRALKKAAQQILRDDEADSSDKQSAEATLKDITQSDGENIHAIGERFFARVAAIFGLSPEEFFEKYFSPSAKADPQRINPETEKKKIFYRLGRGSLNILSHLTDRMENRKKWRIEVTLPDTPGELDRFLQDFTRQGVNIDEITFPTGRLPDTKEMKGNLALSDLTGKLGPREFLRIFLKYTYRDYQIKVCDPEKEQYNEE